MFTKKILKKAVEKLQKWEYIPPEPIPQAPKTETQDYVNAMGAYLQQYYQQDILRQIQLQNQLAQQWGTAYTQEQNNRIWWASTDSSAWSSDTPKKSRRTLSFTDWEL